MELYEVGAAGLSSMFRSGEVSSVEIVESFLHRIEQVDPHLRAFITRTPDMALATAAEVDSRRKRGVELHPLAGIPVAVKDNISTAGVLTTCASRILSNYKPPFNATVIEALEKAGMPILGKTNLDEFAMGSSTENSAFFPTCNPWDLTRVPGGSSGGSAAAVSSLMAPLALGSDTGGSIRQPASFCGVTGLRPTYGRVSRYGLVAFASSLDQVGVLGRSALDCAMLMNLIAGYDPLDSTSLPEPVGDYTKSLEPEVKNLKIGILNPAKSDGFEVEITAAVANLAMLMEEAGADVEEVSISLTDYGLSAYYLIAPSEASSNLGRYDGVRYGCPAGGNNIEELFSRTRARGFGAEVKRRIMIGTYALSAGYYDAYYLKAMQVRTLIRREYDKLFSSFDILLGPSSPTCAFKIGEKTGDPLKMYLSDVCNINESLAGVPSLALPCGVNSEGLPLGIQLSAAPLREDLLFKVAHFFEKRLDHMRPGPKMEYLVGGN